MRKEISERICSEATTEQMNEGYHDYLGNVFPTLKEKCEHYHIPCDTYLARVKYGWTEEDALTVPLKAKKKAHDHLGQEFPSVKAKCRFYGIPYSTYIGRIKRGWSEKDALTMRVESKCRTDTEDHLGNNYASIKEKCDHYKVAVNTYYSRIKKGWSEEDALSGKRQWKCTDHLGNTFPSAQVKCRFYHIRYATYKKRLEQGWSEEEALTTKVQDDTRTEDKVLDHLGNEFPSIMAKCEHYHITYQTYIARINNDWTEEDALTIKIQDNKSPKGTVTDHLGNEFPSQKAKCEYHNISLPTYLRRIHSGWTEEEALTKKASHTERHKKVHDHLGNEYPTQKAKCEHYNISYIRYMYRITTRMDGRRCAYGEKRVLERKEIEIIQ